MHEKYGKFATLLSSARCGYLDWKADAIEYYAQIWDGNGRADQSEMHQMGLVLPASAPRRKQTKRPIRCNVEPEHVSYVTLHSWWHKHQNARTNGLVQWYGNCFGSKYLYPSYSKWFCDVTIFRQYRARNDGSTEKLNATYVSNNFIIWLRRILSFWSVVKISILPYFFRT